MLGSISNVQYVLDLEMISHVASPPAPLESTHMNTIIILHTFALKKEYSNMHNLHFCGEGIFLNKCVNNGMGGGGEMTEATLWSDDQQAMKLFPHLSLSSCSSRGKGTVFVLLHFPLSFIFCLKKK